MLQDRPDVDEVVGSFLQVVRENVVTPHLQIGLLDRLQVTGLNVRRNDFAGGTDLLAEPVGDRARTGTDLQARPAFTDAEHLKVPDCARVPIDTEQDLALSLRFPARAVNCLD